MVTKTSISTQAPKRVIEINQVLFTALHNIPTCIAKSAIDCIMPGFLRPITLLLIILLMAISHISGNTE